jgi:hypothetical protein
MGTSGTGKMKNPRLSRKGYMHRMAVREAGVSGKGDAIQSADRSINTSGFAYGTWHVQKRMRP